MGKYSTATFKPDIVEEIENQLNEQGEAFNNIINESIRDLIRIKKMRDVLTDNLAFGGITSKGLIVDDANLDGKPCRVTLKDSRFWCSECKPKFCMHITYALLHPKVGELEDQSVKK